MRKILFCLLFLGVLAVSGCNRPPNPPDVVVVDQNTTKTVLNLVNKERTTRGLQPLITNNALQTEANRYVGVMAKQNVLSHTLEGDFGDRIRRSGYTGRSFGENIAMGYTSPQAVVTGWMNSPGHRANILNPNYRDTGIGVHPNGNNQLYWCQTFGQPR